ncbi:hypothetical protein IE077_001274, partial [Cardiosporidium cionae]
ICYYFSKLLEYGSDVKDSAISQLHAQKWQKIITFFVYLVRFEGQYISVITVFGRLVEKLDRSISRLFLLLLLKCCGPPFSSDFCRPLLQILEKAVTLSIFTFYNKQLDSEQRRFLKLIEAFLDEAERCDQPKATPSDVKSLVQLVRKGLLEAPS